METMSIYAIANRYDPTHTTALRNAFAADMRRRFTELTKVIRKSIVINDCFGMRKNPLQIHQMTPAAVNAFNFARSSQKVEEFMKWLEEQVDRGILDVRVLQQVGTSVESAWTNLYIYDTYKRGVIRAQYELRKAGMNIPSPEEGQFQASLMSGPFHVDRVGLLFTRVFSDLKGITAAMDAQISRVLAQGMADGDDMRLIARKLVGVVNGDGVDRLGLTDTLGRFMPAMLRATILARTEIIRAYHLAMIQEYRNWGLLNIKVMGEWKTAGDDRVCSKCEALDGKIFTLDEIEPMIPYHPQCRCIALPYIEEIQKYR